MKKYFLFIITIFVAFCSFLAIKNVSAYLPLTGKLIIIDPGHGGKDPGTKNGNILEKDINLSISKKLKNVLEKNGAAVIMTRDGDYDLSSPQAKWRKKSDFDNRINLINKSHADMYLSIHLNYLNDSKYYGGQVFYSSNNENLAKVIQKHLNRSLKNDKKTKPIPRNTYMYSKLIIKGVLIECGFLSNANETNLLIDENYQHNLALVITEAIIDYY